jgi:ApaG protein
MQSQDVYQIQVNVTTEFIQQQSDPQSNRYAFAYHIQISNQGSLPAQLLNRHWKITDGNGKVTEVRGEGVVGEQPLLSPGETFQYTSGTILETPVGSMQGSYQMLADNGQTFDADIPAFRLSVPGALH